MFEIFIIIDGHSYSRLFPIMELPYEFPLASVALTSAFATAVAISLPSSNTSITKEGTHRLITGKILIDTCKLKFTHILINNSHEICEKRSDLLIKGELRFLYQSN